MFMAAAGPSTQARGSLDSTPLRANKIFDEDLAQIANRRVSLH